MAMKLMAFVLRTIAIMLYIATGLGSVVFVMVIVFWLLQKPLGSLTVPTQEPVTVLLGIIVPALFTAAKYVNSIASRYGEPGKLVPSLAAGVIVMGLLFIMIGRLKEQPPVAPTAPPQINGRTEPDSSAPPRDAPAEKPLPSPASIDKSPVGNSSLITVKTQAGHEVHVTSLELGIYVHGDLFSMDDRFLGFSAVPLDSGIRVSFDYIRSVKFGGSTKDFGPVQITLTDGSVMNGNLGGVEEVHPGMTVIGKTMLGEFRAKLADLRELIFLRPEEKAPLPQALPAGPTATIYHKNGRVIRISRPSLEFIRRIPGSTMSCEVLSGSIVRTVEGLVIRFEKIREIQIIDNSEKHVNPIPIELISVDGQRLKTALVALGGPLDPTAVPCYGWRLNGKVEIGDFALGLSFVERIIFDQRPN
jgi:hypothetical protein